MPPGCYSCSLQTFGALEGRLRGVRISGAGVKVLGWKASEVAPMLALATTSAVGIRGSGEPGGRAGRRKSGETGFYRYSPLRPPVDGGGGRGGCGLLAWVTRSLLKTFWPLCWFSALWHPPSFKLLYALRKVTGFGNLRAVLHLVERQRGS